MTTGPRRIGKYELREHLGSGGMSEVWKAFDTQLQRYVAIKLLHADLQNDPEFMNRFVREARLVASLHHPNIVQLHDFQIVGPPESPNGTIAYMVMDYIEGPTLADYIRSTSGEGKFPSAGEIVHLFTSISRAIDYAHQKGMIHRDIKPVNILLDQGNTTQNPMGEPILSDFGIAKLLGSSTGMLSGMWLSTPLYISPEQVQGYPGNERSDIYALGVMLYEICTGVPPFRGGKPTDIMQQHVNAMPTAPTLINPNIPPALTMVIMRALAKDPAARFPSASSMAVALAQSFNMSVSSDLGLASHPTEALSEPESHTPLQLNRPQSMTPVSPMMGAAQLQQSTGLSTPQFQTPAIVGQSNPTTSVSNTPGGYSVASSAPSLPTITPLPTPSGAPPLAPSPTPAPNRRRRGLFVALIALLILVLIGSGLGALYALTHNTTPAVVTTQSVGQAFFVSSGQLMEGSTQGINDQFQISLHNITDPAPGKSYYAWLLGDLHKNAKENHCKPQEELVFLGMLSVNHSTVQYTYSSPQHTNLLTCNSRFLITEESAASTPSHPSTDTHAWRYYAKLPQTPDPKDVLNHLSALDDLRHLLSEGSGLINQGIHGGLDIRLLRNMQKVWEWASSARDVWGATNDNNFIHRQLVRIMEYLDGDTLKLELPGAPILVNPQLSQVAMIDLPKQTGSYMGRISHQLNSIAHAPDVPQAMRALAAQLNKEIIQIKQWLLKVHQYAKQLVTLTDTQLRQPQVVPILDTLKIQADYAFSGQIDPSTNQLQAGVAQFHYGVQQLASFDVTPYTAQ